MELIETITAIPSKLKDIPDRGPGMFFRFIDATEDQKGIYELGEKKGTPMVNLWNVIGANIVESAAVTEHVMVVRERSGSITRLRDFPELKKGDKFRITEGKDTGRLFTLQSLYNSGPYWIIAFDEVRANEAAWAVISTWVEVEPVYPVPAQEPIGGWLDPEELVINLSNLQEQITGLTETTSKQDKFLGYVASQLNILIDIANLAVNSDNLATIQALLRPLNYMRDNYLKETFHAAKPQTGPNTEQDEKDRAAGIRAAGASPAGFNTSTPDSL